MLAGTYELRWTNAASLEDTDNQAVGLRTEANGAMTDLHEQFKDTDDMHLAYTVHKGDCVPDLREDPASQIRR